MPDLVNGVLPGLAIYRQGFIVHPPRGVPGMERSIQRVRVNANQAIANATFVGDDSVSVRVVPKHRPNRRWPCTRACRISAPPPRDSVAPSIRPATSRHTTPARRSLGARQGNGGAPSAFAQDGRRMSRPCWIWKVSRNFAGRYKAPSRTSNSLKYVGRRLCVSDSIRHVWAIWLPTYR